MTLQRAFNRTISQLEQTNQTLHDRLDELRADLALIMAEVGAGKQLEVIPGGLRVGGKEIKIIKGAINTTLQDATSVIAGTSTPPPE